MQNNPRPSQAQRPTVRPQQNGYVQNPRPAVRPQQAAGRPVNNNVRTAQTPARPQVRQPVRQAPAAGSRPAYVQRQQMPAASRRPAPSTAKGETFTGRRDMKPLMYAGAFAAAIILVGCLMQYVLYPNGYFPGGGAERAETVAEIASSRGVRINEVMTSNKTALSDDKGAYPDWIELMNYSSSAVDISGWALLDKASRSTYFTFPEYVLDAGETVIVYASGRLSNEAEAAFHAPFRLSSAGDTLMLSDAHSTVVESINIPSLGANQAYAQRDGGWIITGEYTPGLENTSLNYAALTSTQPVAGSTLIITEVVADNASVKAPDGMLYDWIEIRNTGSAAVNLGGYALSDSPSAPSQWKFPSVVIEPGQCLVVYASGLNRQDDDGTLHTSFGLRAEGESVLLYGPTGQVLDYVEFDNLKTDQAVIRQSDGSYTISGAVSPGQAN